MSDILRVWERQPFDTPHSWAAFSKFIEMPIYGEEGEQRTLKNLSVKMGHNSPKQVSKWSAAHKWSERLAAYDAYMGSKAITFAEVSLEQFRSAHLTRISQQLSVTSTIVEKRLKQLLDALGKNEIIDTMDIKRMIDSIDRLDIIGRRASGLPTTFISGEGQEPDYEQQTFIIGGE